MAGHSKWANIKHKKARMDAKRGKAWSKCSKAIMVAAKQGGGDPATNLTLRYAIDEAKSANMPKDTIENAIKKGTGDVEGVNYEDVMYEGYGPGGVAIMVDCLTDKRTRTAPEMKKIFEKAGCSLGTPGCVSYTFQQRGQFVLPGTLDEETVMDIVLEAGAEDISNEGDGEESIWLVSCAPTDFSAVRDALESAEMKIESAEITMIPETTVALTGSDAEKLLRLLDTIEDHDDVQKVYSNHEISAEDMAKFA